MEAKKSAKKDLPALETLDADHALFQGRIQGIVARLRADQRPLQGLAGLLDWRFQGAISHALKKGFLTGAPGECAYLPLTRAGTTYHVLLVGVGSGSEADEGEALPAETLRALKKNLASLKLEGIAVSRSDFGKGISTFKGAPVCIIQ